MSHFLTFVIVGREEADVEQKARDLLKPYFDREGAGVSGNPLAKCDGFTIGGQYDGQIFGALPMYNLSPEEYQQRYGLDVVKPLDNIRPAKEVPRTLVPYAILTPEGEWFDGEHQERARWRREAAGLLEKYADYLVVAVDCHC